MHGKISKGGTDYTWVHCLNLMLFSLFDVRWYALQWCLYCLCVDLSNSGVTSSGESTYVSVVFVLKVPAISLTIASVTLNTFFCLKPNNSLYQYLFTLSNTRILTRTHISTCLKANTWSLQTTWTVKIYRPLCKTVQKHFWIQFLFMYYS